MQTLTGLRALCEAERRGSASIAIYHCSVKTISRSAGRSATAAAAYRAGEKITDTRTAEVHDYRRRHGVESADIVLPDDAPEWATDRAALWNAAEQAEKRKNSTVAREFELALPEELDPAERRALALAFAGEIAKRHGVAVDVAIHAPGGEGDQRNHHAHLLTTTRRLGPDGFGPKARELDDKKTGPAIVTEWRERWADLQNEALKKKGVLARVDHRSLAEQGLDREPTQHLGPAASGYERRTGQASRKRQDWQELASERLARAKEQGERERAAKRSNAPALYVPHWIAEEIKQDGDTATQQPDIRGQGRLSQSGLCDLSQFYLAGTGARIPERPAALAAVVQADENAYRPGDMDLRRANIRRESGSSSSGSSRTGAGRMTTAGQIGQVLQGIHQAAEAGQEDDQAEKRDSRSLADRIAAGRAGLRSMHTRQKEDEAEKKKREEARQKAEQEAKAKAEREQRQKQGQGQGQGQQPQAQQKSGFKHPKPRGK